MVNTNQDTSGSEFEPRAGNRLSNIRQDSSLSRRPELFFNIVIETFSVALGEYFEDHKFKEIPRKLEQVHWPLVTFIVKVCSDAIFPSDFRRPTRKVASEQTF